MESNCKIVRSCTNNWSDCGTYTEALEEVLGLNIDIELSTLVLGNIEGRDFGDVLILSFSLFFLELEGDTTDRTALNTLHQMGSVAGDLFECSC
jgi:hypothetical protein